MVFHGFSMGFPWVFHGFLLFSMVFYCFLGFFPGVMVFI